MNPKNCPNQGMRVDWFLFIVTAQHCININLKEGPNNNTHHPIKAPSLIIIIINPKNKK
jgi:hypothetical protein